MKTNEEMLDELSNDIKMYRDGYGQLTHIIGKFKAFLQAKEERVRLEKFEIIESVPEDLSCWNGCGIEGVGADVKIMEWKQYQLNKLN